MANVYDVKLSNGETHTVEVSEHHDSHSESRFKQILLDALKSSVSGASGGIANSLTSAAITIFIFKGRRK